jgi:NDP-sugar pyrophosphorylase family protein
MILAAGRGERMHPLSLARAKPALPILDEPLVARLVRQLAEQGVRSAVVNVHAQPESLRAALREAPMPVEFSPERELLGSGGGIRAARRLLEDGTFLVLNGDMCLDLDIPALLEAHAAGGAIATLALRDDARKERLGSIGYDQRGDVCRVTDRIRTLAEKGSGLFTGVQVLEPVIFEHMPDRMTFHAFDDLYVPLLTAGERIACWLQPLEQGWWPVGSPAELLEANLVALRRLEDIEPGVVREGEAARVEGEVSGPAWIGERAHIEEGACVGPFTVVGAGSCVPAGFEVEASLWLPDARPEGAPRRLRGAIAHGREVWVDA